MFSDSVIHGYGFFIIVRMRAQDFGLAISVGKTNLLIEYFRSACQMEARNSSQHKAKELTLKVYPEFSLGFNLRLYLRMLIKPNLI